MKASTYLAVVVLAALVAACGNVQTQIIPTATMTLAATETIIIPATASATLAPTQTKPPTVTASPTLGIGATQTSPKDGMLMLYVPAGSFLMGSDKSVDPHAFNNELPQHTVNLDAFWIDQTPITNAMFALCVAAGSCIAPQSTRSYTHASYYGNSQYADYPVVNVNWNQADAYCRWAGRQLPTEAQWEKAARGTDGRIYPWGNQAPDKTLANLNLMVGDTTKVGSYPAGASPYGALDMAGNVYEWIADWFSENYYSSSPASNPPGPTSGISRVIRGGSYGNSPNIERSAARDGRVPVTGGNNFGFRCAYVP